jgi:hypothetical protein
LEGGLSLALEGDNDKADEDVDHEEGDDNEIDEVEKEHSRPVVLLRPNVRLVGVNGDVQDPANNLFLHMRNSHTIHKSISMSIYSILQKNNTASSMCFMHH